MCISTSFTIFQQRWLCLHWPKLPQEGNKMNFSTEGHSRNPAVTKEDQSGLQTEHAPVKNLDDNMNKK